MKKADFLRLLSRKLTDGLSPEEAQRLTDALVERGDYKRKSDILTHYFQTERPPTMAGRIRLARVWEAIETTDEAAQRRMPGAVMPDIPAARPRWGKVLRAAAVILCGAAIVTLAYNALRPRIAPEFLEIRTADSQQFTTLDDGTFVVLKQGSTLRYNTDFGKHHRRVDLQGEAYFEVAENKEMPLVVHADGFQVNVTGTIFQVTAYADAPTASVALIEGSIEVSVTGKGTDAETDPVQLKPMQKYEWSRHTPTMPRIVSFPKDSLMAELGWWPAPDSLSFEKEALESVLRKLSKRFKVPIELRNAKLEDIRISGTLSDKVTLEQALEILQMAYPWTYRMEGRKVIIE
ncbi:FecR family protein [Parapedobacter sp.]